jgi:hypothetical protein
MVYALAYAAKAGLPSRGGSWMGGNVLFAFDGQTSSTPAQLAAPKWLVPLPTAAVGMTPIPGGPGGVFVGANTDDTTGADRGGVIHHYTKDGLLIGSFKSAPAFGVEGSQDLPSGAFDAFSAISCNRDPRDGILASLEITERRCFGISRHRQLRAQTGAKCALRQQLDAQLTVNRA